MNKIVVDAFGGDHAPLEILKGCAMALAADPNAYLVIVGDEDIVRGILAEEKADMMRVEIVHATDVIENEDSAATAIRSREGSTLVVALNILREREDVVGLISAGSTGAVLAGAQIKLGRIKGIQRAALLSIFPTIMGDKKVYLMDCGSVMDAKPEFLEQFALMGNEYVKVVSGIENPRIALLNVGTEEGKGNELYKAAYDLLEAHKELNFVGNVEARTYITGEVDLIVADGFGGNILMKATEGAGMNFAKIVKEAMMSAWYTRIAAMFMKKKLKKALRILDFNYYGGAYFLGVKKLICKAHGASRARSISICVKETYELANAKLPEKIESLVSKAEN